MSRYRTGLTKRQVQQRFLAYLNQRSTVTLAGFCTALNMPINGKGSGQIVQQIDRWITAALPPEGSRQETGEKTGFWTVKYHAVAPQPQTHLAAPPLKTWIDPRLKGTWEPTAKQARTNRYRGGKQTERWFA